MASRAVDSQHTLVAVPTMSTCVDPASAQFAVEVRGALDEHAVAGLFNDDVAGSHVEVVVEGVAHGAAGDVDRYLVAQVGAEPLIVGGPVPHALPGQLHQATAPPALRTAAARRLTLGTISRAQGTSSGMPGSMKMFCRSMTTSAVDRPTSRS